jgi:hypothetical protein
MRASRHRQDSRSGRRHRQAHPSDRRRTVRDTLPARGTSDISSTAPVMRGGEGDALCPIKPGTSAMAKRRRVRFG